MASPRTNIFLSDEVGQTVINDFDDATCLNCITTCSRLGYKTANCSIDGAKRHVYFTHDEKGQLYICDDKERTSKNFSTLVELIKHCRPSLIARYRNIAADIQRTAFREIDAFQHNIVHINAEAINEFYSYITQDTLVTQYWKLHDLISENITRHKEDSVELIAKLARHNLRIKTELSVMSKLSNPDGKPSFNVGKPRDAIMSNVYMNFPMFNKRKIYVKVAESWDKFNIDFDALQVASFYIIENATKYTQKGSTLTIDFKMASHLFSIIFRMNSLFISQSEIERIFDEGYRGEEAQKTKMGGKGIGLYRAKQLVNYFNGELILKAGTDRERGNDGFYYADNTFIIELPVSMPVT